MVRPMVLMPFLLMGYSFSMAALLYVIWGLRKEVERMGEFEAALRENARTIVALCEERDAANELAISMGTLLDESQKIVTAADVQIAAAQTREWLRQADTAV